MLTITHADDEVNLVLDCNKYQTTDAELSLELICARHGIKKHPDIDLPWHLDQIEFCVSHEVFNNTDFQKELAFWQLKN